MDEQTSSEEHSTDSGESNELYNPDASPAAILGDMQNTTPKIRRMQGSSTASSQKSAALAVDPNGGRCLLTRERIPTVAIQACHLLAQATKPPQVSVNGLLYFRSVMMTRVVLAHSVRMALGFTTPIAQCRFVAESLLSYVWLNIYQSRWLTSQSSSIRPSSRIRRKQLASRPGFSDRGQNI